MTSLRASLAYLRYMLRHKWYVFLAGLVVGAPLWRLLVHDWTKFLPREWGPYVMKFYGKAHRDAHVRERLTRLVVGSAECPAPQVALDYAAATERLWDASVDRAFDNAWRHHQKRNDHHWQAWVLMEDRPQPRHAWWRITSPDEARYFSLRVGPDGGGTAIPLPMLGAEGARAPEDLEVRRVWLRHAVTLVEDANRYRALEMPEAVVREMVADWMGTGRTITGKWEAKSWYEANRANIVLHERTEALVESILERAHLAGRA